MFNTTKLGATVTDDGVDFAVYSEHAERMWLCLFKGDDEAGRLPMTKGEDNVFRLSAPGLLPGTRYGFRADGEYAPERGLWFDPDKLLLDPYAKAIDRPFTYDAALTVRRGQGDDTAGLVPRGIVINDPEPVAHEAPRFDRNGVIYEVQVRSFTMKHPDVPEAQRGTIAALAHPAIIDHLKSLRVSAVELMPITAWIDERHLGPLGLTNAWGYNPVSYFALDPRLAPGGIEELRTAVAALHAEGIGVILDVVFNHNGESDEQGPTLSFRGLDARNYFRHSLEDEGRLINDTGCGNTLRCEHFVTSRLILDSMRWFVEMAGIDGFRFDLAPILGRGPGGFDPDAALIRDILMDPELSDRILIAEPWDIGPDGYQLGNFPPPFLEWNDRYRDDVRRYWRGDAYARPDFATRLAGSSDVYQTSSASRMRTVNFIAAHDGFTLADTVAYEERHNLANGEDNRDGHSVNHSWNNGVEGPSDDDIIVAARRRDVKALLSTLFVSRGAIMLTAGDEFGRTQQGNNNAYAQDNDITWLDWENRELDIQEHAFTMARIRAAAGNFESDAFLSEQDVTWRKQDGREKTAEDWNNPEIDAFALDWQDGAMALMFNRSDEERAFCLPNRQAVHVAPRSVEVLCNLDSLVDSLVGAEAEQAEDVH